MQVYTGPRRIRFSLETRLSQLQDDLFPLSVSERTIQVRL